MTHSKKKTLILIIYTTLYRKGGQKFVRAAFTLEKEKKLQYPNIEIFKSAVESKSQFHSLIRSIEKKRKYIFEFHFIGHAGMYGPMFGTSSWPEQFSPYEWKTMKIPFAKGAQVWIRTCRSARWFAPFLADTLGLPVWGNFLYTSFSLNPDRFIPSLSKKIKENKPLYVVGCPGKKSHGLLGTLWKYSAFVKTEKMKCFMPSKNNEDGTYNKVSQLYDEAFSDIAFRHAEWKWLEGRMPTEKKIRILDIGCGNGALLKKLSGRISFGAGVDKSGKMIELAKKRNIKSKNISFIKIDKPFLPFKKDSFDIVISLCSFRYLDWDPILCEIRRVLTPAGKLIIIDMVTAPLKIREIPRMLVDKISNFFHLFRNTEFKHRLCKLVEDPNWHIMLKFNPIRAEHEMKWYLESRFPGQKLKTLNIGWNSRILAFESGPSSDAKINPLTFP